MSSVRDYKLVGFALAIVSLGTFNCYGQELILEFPADRVVGTVETRPVRERGTLREFVGDWEHPVEAKGTLRVPDGHQVQLWVSADAAKDLSFLRKLPADGIYALNMWRSRAEDDQAAHLAALTGLRQLRLEDTRFTGQGLKQLAPLTQLELLSYDAYMPNMDLQRAASADPFAPRQTNYDLLKYGFDDEAAAVFGNMPKLRLLSLRMNPISYISLLHIGRLQELQYLSLEDTRIADKGLELLTNLKNLKSLSFGVYDDGAPINDIGASKIAKIENLESLQLNGSQITVKGLEFLAEMPQLKDLNVEGIKFSPAELSVLSASPSLAKLHADWRQAESLNLENSAISDGGLQSLTNLKELSYLSIGGALTLDGLSVLKELPVLKSLWVESPYFGKEHVQSLESILQTTSVNVQGGDRVLFPGMQDGILRRSSKQRLAMDALEGRQAPALQVSHWFPDAGESTSWTSFSGKVVLVNIRSSTSNRNTRRSKSLQEVYDKYADAGFEIIEMHSTQEFEEVQAYVLDTKPQWPVAIDQDRKTAAALLDEGDGYHLIDRKGNLRVAHLAEQDLDKAVQMLLDEGGR